MPTKTTYLLLLLPLTCMVCYLATGLFVWRTTTTLACLLIVIFSCWRHSLKGATYICLAFTFSLFGDLMLGHSGSKTGMFVGGAALFLVAHLCYTGFCLLNGRINWRMFLLLTTLFLAYYGVCLMPVIKEIPVSMAVLSYTIVSCLSFAAALGLQLHDRIALLLFCTGIGSLLFSDTLISLDKFLHQSSLYPLMMPTYFASQVFVTAAVIRLATGTKRGTAQTCNS